MADPKVTRREFVRQGTLAAAGLAAGVHAATTSAAEAKPAKKIVLIASHGHHPNEPGIALMKKCLESSPNVPGLVCETHNDWPADAATLDGAAAIVIYSEGTNQAGLKHPILQGDRLALLDRLAAKGAGLVCIHYTLYATREVEAPYLLKWIGGYYDFQGYGSTHAVSDQPIVSTPVRPDHPISRGWSAFTIPRNEYYHRLRFAEDAKAVTPILTAPFPAKDGGQPKSEVIAWAMERPGGGRGFGFGGGHFQESWGVEGYRRMLLNAVVWAAGIDVPKEGVRWAVSDAELGLKTK